MRGPQPNKFLRLDPEILATSLFIKFPIQSKSKSFENMECFDTFDFFYHLGDWTYLLIITMFRMQFLSWSNSECCVNDIHNISNLCTLKSNS